MLQCTNADEKPAEVSDAGLLPPSDGEKRNEAPSTKRLGSESSKKMDRDDVIDEVKKCARILQHFYDEEPEKFVENVHNAIFNVRLFYWNILLRDYRQDICNVIVESHFFDYCVKYLLLANEAGIFSNDSIWFIAFYILSLLQNYTDMSANIVAACIKHGLPELCVTALCHKEYFDNIATSKNVLQVIKYNIGIMNNLCNSIDGQERAKELGAVDCCKNLLALPQNEQTLSIAFSAQLCLAKLCANSDSTAVMDTLDLIPKLGHGLERALREANKRHRYKGFAAAEIAEGLSLLAVNDGNKKKIVDSNIIPLLDMMLDSEDVEEVTMSLKCIWSLSFSADVRPSILAQEGLVDKIERLTSHENAKIVKTCRGALWILCERDKTRQQESELDLDSKKIDSGLIFISYSHAQSGIVKRIKKSLDESNFKTLIDFENVNDSILEWMATAVESSSIVLICYSEDYRRSNACRTEAEYCFQLQKPFIPLNLYYRYKPSGWLGGLLGTKYYIDFSLVKYAFEDKCAELFKTLGKVLNSETAVVGNDGPIEVIGDTLSVSHGHQLENCHYGRSNRGHAPPVEIKQWKVEQVSDFLTKENLSAHIDAFSSVTGHMFWMLIALRYENLEVFCHISRSLFSSDEISILRFLTAIDTLCNDEKVYS